MRKPIYIALLVANILLAIYLVVTTNPPTEEVVQPLALVGEKPLRLVTEASTADRESSAAITEKVDTRKSETQQAALSSDTLTGGQEAEPRICRVWGPVATEDEFDPLKDRLRSQQSTFEIISAEIEGPPKYLVLVEPDGPAKTVASQLNKAGVENYVINREAGPILSTGVFSSYPRAEKHRNKVKNLGVSVAIEILEDPQQAFFLKAQVSAESPEYLDSNSDCPTFAHAH